MDTVDIIILCGIVIAVVCLLRMLIIFLLKKLDASEVFVDYAEGKLTRKGRINILIALAFLITTVFTNIYIQN